MRILHIITTLSTGGAEMVLYRLLSSPWYRNHEVIVFCLESGGDVANLIKSLGIRIEVARIRSERVPRVWEWKRLHQVTKKFRPDIIHSWMTHANLLGLTLRSAAGSDVPLLWSVRQSLPSLSSQPWMRARLIALAARLSSRVEGIIYNSQISAKQHEALGFDSSRRLVIPNGIDVNSFKPDPVARKEVREEVGFTTNDFVIGMVARYHPMKDHGNFIEAAQLVVKEVPHVRFLLAGREITESNSALVQKLVDCGIKGRCVLLGNRDDPQRIMAASDLIVSASSTDEAFPNVVAEALACGVPCVVTDIGESRTIIGGDEVDNCGKVVPPRQPQLLANSIIELAHLEPSERQKLGLAGRKRIERLFSLDSMVNAYANVYESLMECGSIMHNVI